MSMSDPIADLLTRIRNGQQAEKVSVSMPSSKLKIAVVHVLKDEGYVSGYAQSEVEGKPTLTVDLKYFDGKPVIAKVKRISRPGLRRYVNRNDMPEVLGGLGIAVVSTSKGVMTGTQAKAQGFGGEVICTVC
jgi:small subunit ribosomal protein S8